MPYADPKSPQARAANQRKSKRFADKYPERIRLRNRHQWQKHGLRYRLKKNGWTEAEYNQRFQEQDFRCAICQCTDPTGRGRGNWVPDHDHGTGRHRGILCHNCNVSLGLLGENEITIERMIRYIRRYSNGVQK